MNSNFRRRVRYVELEGERALHLDDAVSAGLIRPGCVAAVRYVVHEDQTYVHQQDLIDNDMLNDYVGVEITQGGNHAQE